MDDEARRRFIEVVLPHLEDAYALACWLTGNGADAADVVQDAALRALGAIGNFTDKNPRAWTLTIVRNCAYSWLAKNRPKEMVLTDDLEAAERVGASVHGQTDAPTPESDVIGRQDKSRLAAAIGTLPVPYREVLLLRDVRGLRYREIAVVMAVPIGAVMSRLARARELLIAALREDKR